MAKTPESEALHMSHAERRAEYKRIKKERKILRKRLREQGIKKRIDFETFAREVGLALPEKTWRGMGILFFMRASRIAAVVKTSIGLSTVLLGSLGLLGGTLFVAWITEERGHFTINLTADMMKEGFLLSETNDFSEEKTKLYSDEIVNVNATSINVINRGIAEKDGNNNGPGYLSFTFYLTNDGDMTVDYGYTVNITSETMNALDASWMMFFEDDKQIVYAKMSGDGNPEELYGYKIGPFIEQAYDPEAQYYTEDGLAGIITTPYIDDHTALQGYVQELEPGEVKKYTIVIWVEGDDPDCTNAIMGGHVGFSIQFDRLGEDITGFFKGLYREEYAKTQAGERLELKPVE